MDRRRFLISGAAAVSAVRVFGAEPACTLVAEQEEGPYEGGHVCHTGQIFLPEELTEGIAGMSPYAGNSKVHRTAQAEDRVFQEQQGAGLVAGVERAVKNGKDADGFVASIMLAVDPEATPAPAGPRGGRGRFRPRTA